MKSAPARDIDAYIAAAPTEARTMLRELRQAIKATAPQASEGISYQIPTYKHQGMLVSFAAWKNHIGLYAISSVVIAAHKDELKDYEIAKGTIRFPIGHPLPIALIKTMVKERLAENETRKSGYRKGG